MCFLSYVDSRLKKNHKNREGLLWERKTNRKKVGQERVVRGEYD
jgi:hypothetical protein